MEEIPSPPLFLFEVTEMATITYVLLLTMAIAMTTLPVYCIFSIASAIGKGKKNDSRSNT